MTELEKLEEQLSKMRKEHRALISEIGDMKKRHIEEINPLIERASALSKDMKLKLAISVGLNRTYENVKTN